MPGMANRMSAGYGQIDPAAQFRMLTEGNAQTGGNAGIRWEQYADTRYEDPALREIRSEAAQNDDINAIFVQKYSQAGVELYSQMVQRRGLLYEEYRAALEAFRMNKMGMHCPARSEFVDTINRHPEMVPKIAAAAMPLFGQRLITEAKSTPNGELGKKSYFEAEIFAVQGVLVMEMISWLCKHPQGRQWAFRLPKDVAEWVGRLEAYKDIFNAACVTFNTTNPYAQLVWDAKPPTRPDTHLVSEAQSAYLYNDYTRSQGVQSSSQGVPADTLDMIVRSAAKSRQRAMGGGGYQQAVNPVVDSGQVSWNRTRNDMQNLTRENMEDFHLSRLFHSIGKPNHYFIPESDWKRIQHVYRRHEEQSLQEETVFNGTFRIVILDLDNPDAGWFSTVVRSEKIDMTTALTSPEKLLPLLEANSDSGEIMVNPVALDDALVKGARGKKEKEIDVDFCEKLEGIPLITIPEKVVTQSSKKLTAAIDTTNERLTENLKTPNATAFHAVIWDNFTCGHPDDKIRLREDVPFLFQGGIEDERRPSYFHRIKSLAKYFKETEIDEELVDYVTTRLTAVLNDWFVSCLGYDKQKTDNHLSITNILEDYDDLDEHLEQNDTEAYRWFNAPASAENYLTESMRLFLLEDKYASLDQEEAGGIIYTTQKELDLFMERKMYVVTVNKRNGPMPDGSGEPIVIKRSKFPEYFDLIEKGFEPTMGVDANPRAVDKLIQFEGGDHLWLFSYSSYDINSATLRCVSRRRSLIFLDMI